MRIIVEFHGPVEDPTMGKGFVLDFRAAHDGSQQVTRESFFVNGTDPETCFREAVEHRLKEFFKNEPANR